MNWDTEIWAPCRLGEAFTLRDLGYEKEQYLYAIKADWMGNRGDAMCVRCSGDLEKETPYNVRVGAGPRPWANCWTYEPKIKIAPPVWCWDMQDDTMFGLDFKPKRNGNRRKVKLSCVMIHKGRPVYRIVVEMADGDTFQYLDSIPVLDPYFAPIWPATAEETTVVAEPAPEPVADPVAETVLETPETVTNAPEPERTPEKTEQTTDSPKSTDVAILPSLANCPERDTAADLATAAAYAVGGIIHTHGLELEADPGELIIPLNPQYMSAGAVITLAAAGLDYTVPPRLEVPNLPPGACIGGRTPFSGKYYYYVWFEEPTTEGETYEQKTGP